MFGAYQEHMDKRAKRQLAASLVVSIVLYGGGITAVALAADAVVPKDKEKEVEVVFYKAVPEPPPPPAPKPEPPPPALPEPPPPAPEPPPPKPKPKPKVRKGRKPPPKAPTKMPDKPAAEAEPTDGPKPEPETLDGDLPQQWGDPEGESAEEGKVFGEVDGELDVEGPPDPPPPPPPVILPAGATRPQVIGSLVSEADYPRGALAARIEGTVIVKVAVRVDGTVKLVRFIKRDPNFEEAVLNILKRLRFKPAVYNGKPIAVYQNLKFPFTLD